MSDTAKIIEIAALRPGENRIHLSPDDDACAAIAKRLGEPGVSGLTCDFVLEPTGSGVLVAISIRAQVSRLCVASLEPMTETIDESYTIRFERDFVEDTDAENLVEELAREPLEDETLDLDELMFQHLALSLAPHPRKAGAPSLAESYKDPVNLSPFSVLKGVVDGDA